MAAAVGGVRRAVTGAQRRASPGSNNNNQRDERKSCSLHARLHGGAAKAVRVNSSIVNGSIDSISIGQSSESRTQIRHRLNRFVVRQKAHEKALPADSGHLEVLEGCVTPRCRGCGWRCRGRAPRLEQTLPVSCNEPSRDSERGAGG